MPIPESIERGIFTALREEGFSISNVFMEHLDFSRGSERESRIRIRNQLQYKLGDTQVDIVITIGALATDFLAREGKGLFPGTMVISLISPNSAVLPHDYGKVINIPWKVDPSGTLSTALSLFPETRRIFVVTGANDSILPFLDEVKKAFSPWEGKLEFEFSNEMTYDEMLRRVSTLPPDSIILYSPYFVDTTGRSFVPAEVVSRLSQSATAPVFSTLEEYLGRGIVGGSLLRTEDIGVRAGKVATDYLSGRLKLVEPVTFFEPGLMVGFDWRELVRWEADLSQLPKESKIINRPDTLWEKHQKEVIFTFTSFLALGGLIVTLLILNRQMKRTKNIVTASEARFRAMMAYAPEAIILVDVESGQIIDANVQAERLFACSREKLLLEGFERFYVQPQPDDREVSASIRENISRCIAGEVITIERFVHNDAGEDLICEVRIAPLPGFDKVLVRGSFVDITDRKQEEEIRAGLNAELDAKNREMEQMIYIASHDLRSPLITIEGFNGVLDASLDKILSILDREAFSAEILEKIMPFIANSNESREYISKSIVKMSALLDGLAQVTRLGRVAIHKEQLDMNRIMSDVVNEFEFQRKELKVEFEISDLPSCFGDTGQVNQLFFNLIENAFKYHSPDRPCIIKISGLKEGAHSVYCVEDNGVGIDPDYQKRIFEMFHQLDPAVSGEGLGLHIVSKVVDRHNGRVWVESEVGKGSRFYVSL